MKEASACQFSIHFNTNPVSKSEPEVKIMDLKGDTYAVNIGNCCGYQHINIFLNARQVIALKNNLLWAVDKLNI